MGGLYETKQLDDYNNIRRYIYTNLLIYNLIQRAKYLFKLYLKVE